MAVSKPFRYLETLLTTECAGEEFTAKGKEILEEGWKAVERKVLADILNRKQELTALPNAAENECGILNAELKEGQTSPPKHFTEDTSTSRDGNRQCGQYAGGRGASGHRHPGYPCRHH